MEMPVLKRRCTPLCAYVFLFQVTMCYIPLIGCCVAMLAPDIDHSSTVASLGRYPLVQQCVGHLKRNANTIQRAWYTKVAETFNLHLAGRRCPK